MIYRIVAVRDRAADVFGQPFFVASVGAAVRSFGDEVNRSDKAASAMAAHPEDFDLYYLGEYDDSKGEFSCNDPPRVIAVGKDLVK